MSIHPQSSAAPEPRLAYAWFVVGVLMLAQTCSFIDRMIMGLLVEPIRQSFGISDTQYSLLAGFAFSVFYALMGLPLARIADGWSRRTLMAIGIAVWSVMTALCGLAQGFWSLFLARVGVGVGEATLSPSAFSLISDLFPRRILGIALSVFTLGVTLGSGLAYLIGGKVIGLVATLGVVDVPLLGALEGWRLTFLVVGMPGLAIAALMLLAVREPPRRGHDAAVPVVPFAEVLRFVRARRRAVGCHIVGVSLFVLVVYGNNIWGPSYLMRTFGIARGEAGMLFGLIMLIAGSAGLLLAGFVADRWYARGRADAYTRVIMLSALGMLPFALLLGVATSLPLALASLALATFFSAFQGGIAAGTLQLMTPNAMRARVAALYFLTANLVGLGLGPTVVALFTDFVFGDEAAIGKSLAATAAVFIPLAVAIMGFGLRATEAAVREAQQGAG